MPLLFSYGTLQLPEVQLEVFERHLQGSPDSLVGFRMDYVEITDPDVLEKSGEPYHPIVSRTDDPSDTVEGTVFEVTDEELLRADTYEVEDYKRERVMLSSSREAWLYVEA